MKMKYAISASAFVLGAVLAGGAMAQQSGSSSSPGANSSATTDNTAVSIPGLNNNSLDSNKFNGNSVDNNNTTDDHSNNSTNTDASTHQDNSSHSDSHDVTDSNNSTTVDINARLVLATQDLNETVTNVQFGGAGGNGHDDNRSINTGAISWSGGAQQGFGGIMTQNVNTGFASAGEAATSVSANSNVTFSH